MPLGGRPRSLMFGSCVDAFAFPPMSARSGWCFPSRRIGPPPNFPPSWNAAPTDSLPVVRYDKKVGERSLDLLRWGLVPYWAKDLKVGFANINAKAEGIETKPAFREAFQRRRCLVPVDNFTNGRRPGPGTVPNKNGPGTATLTALRLFV